MNKEPSKSAERLNQLEEALRSIANGDMRNSRAKAKMALEGTSPPVDEKPEQEAQSHGNVKDPFYFKGYWYQEYLEMREKYWERTHENSKLAERIRELEEQLKAKQGESRELYAMLGHIVDWSPELPFYMKDEYKTLFRNALAAARELLSKCSGKWEGAQ